MADMMDRTINAILTAFVAVILIASAFIPTALTQISALSTKYGDQVAGYTALLTTVVTITIVGIIMGVVKSYTKEDER